MSEAQSNALLPKDWGTPAAPVPILDFLRASPPELHSLAPLPSYYGPTGTETTTGAGPVRLDTPIDPVLGTFNSIPMTASSVRRLRETASGAIDLGMNFAGPIDAYHGTRHTFPPEPGAPLGAFRDEAIGTGEGAQAYGYGHYVAGRKGVAEHYKKAGLDLAYSPPTPAPPGNLYHVQISPDEHELLDWDRPFESHTPEVQGKIQKAFESFNSVAPPERLSGMTGEDIYRVLKAAASGHAADQGISLRSSSSAAAAVASKALDDAGIPGLRYLDERSRDLPTTIGLNGKPLAEAENVPYVVRTLFKFNQKYHYNLDMKNLGKGLETAAQKETRLRDGGKEYQDALDWFKSNKDKFAPLEHPDATRNYVIFHPQHLRIVGRNGQMLGVEPVDHDPFEESP